MSGPLFFKGLAGLLLLLALSFHGSQNNYKSAGPLLPEVLGEPVQTELAAPARPISCEVGDQSVELTPRYGYDISALVFGVSRKYLSDSRGAIAADLGLLWGKNTDPEIYRHVKLRVMMDWYTAEWPAGRTFDVFAAANNHCVTCDPAVKARLRNLRAGDQVRIRGKLVDARFTGRDGSSIDWKTSTTRRDTRGGSCETLYIEKPDDIEILARGPALWDFLYFVSLLGSAAWVVGGALAFHLQAQREAARMRGS